LKPIIKYIDIFVINKSDAVILPSENREKQIANSFPKRLCFVHNTPIESLLPISSSVKDPSIEITIAYVGVLQPGRLLLEIIDVVSRHPNWKIIIAGFGPLESKIKSYSTIYNNVMFCGAVNYCRSLELNAAADVLFATYDPLVPNHRFSSPNKLYEAMMLAKPIIVCKNTSVDEIVTRELIGLSIDYTAQAFEAAVKNLLEDRDAMNRMSTLSRRLYDTQYSWTVMQKRLLDLYRTI